MIVPHAEGILEPHIPNPVPADEELVELLGLPLKEYRLIIAKKNDMHAYNAGFKDSSKSIQSTLNFSSSLYEWSPSYLANLLHVLRHNYNVSLAKTVYENVVSVINTYLQLRT